MPLPDVIVVGGGIIGCSVAYHLAEAGARVTVVERGRGGGQATGAAAGMLAPGAEADGPGPFLELGLRSLGLFPELAERLRAETRVDVEYVPCGLLYVALDEEEAAALRARLEWQRAAGVEVRWLAGEEARRLEPGLPDTVLAALHYPQEHHVYSPHLVQALALAAAGRGVTFLEGTEAVGLITAGDRVLGVVTAGSQPGRLAGGHVVLAPGAWAGLWGERLGVEIPVCPVRGQIIALEQNPLPCRKVVFSARGYAVPKVRGMVAVGATEDRAGFDAGVTLAGVAYLSRLAGTLLPGLAAARFRHAWAGLRPWSATGLPLIGPVPGWRGLTLAAGHHRNGILLAPLTGRAVAELVLQGASPLLGAAAAAVAPAAPAAAG